MRTAETVLTVLLLAGVAALVAGQALGYPVLLGFVETGSMSPEMEAGDGFIAVPSFLTGSPSVGDVVVFEAEEVQNGGLVTHRIVGETDEGYVTKGDANPFTDQDGGEPYVTEDAVLSEALAVGGNVVTVPRLGMAVETVRGAVAGLLAFVGIGTAAGTQISGVVLFVFGVVLLVAASLDSRRGAKERSRNRSRKRESVMDARLVLIALVALVLLPANIVMVGGTGVQELTTTGAVEGEETGETVDREVTVRNDGFVAMLVVLEPRDGAEVSQRVVELPAGETATVTATTPAPEQNVERTDRIHEYRYFLLLPASFVESLHSTAPVLALAAVNGVLLTGVAGLVVGLLGYGKVRIRETERRTPYTRRLRNLL